MFTEPIEEAYFNWLCAKVESHQGYNSILEILFRYEFIWIIPADKHRVSDALELKQDFMKEQSVDRSEYLDNRPASIFEVLISFADRASFQTDRPANEWFWEFITTLALDAYSEQVFENDLPLINDILYTFVWRIYLPNGEGGLFPMHQTQKDQREIEIWYQFCEYLEDRGYF